MRAKADPVFQAGSSAAESPTDPDDNIRTFDDRSSRYFIIIFLNGILKGNGTFMVRKRDE
jgi:hypothetical protein